MPGNASIAIDEIRKLADFEALNPDGVIKLVDPNSSLKTLIEGGAAEVPVKGQAGASAGDKGNSTASADGPSGIPGNLENAGVESTSMVVNLSTIIAVTAAFLIFLFVAMVAISACKTDLWMIKLRGFLAGFKKKMLFNGIIEYMTIAYVNFCASTAIAL